MTRFTQLGFACVIACLSNVVHAVDEDELLDPKVAFPVEAAVRGDVIRLTWTVADGYYLYRSRFAFKPLDPVVRLGDALIPPGEMKTDPFFGTVETYRGTVMVDLPIDHAGTTDALTLAVTSQGCADLGVCYPPQTEQLKVKLPSSALGSGSGQLLASTTAFDPTRSLAQLAENTRGSSANSSGSLPTSQTRPQSSLIQTPNPSPVAALEQLGRQLVGDNAPEFLPPDQAFQPRVTADDGALRVNWQIAKGYYLYRHQLAFDASVPTSPAELPEGKHKSDEYFGEVEVYYDSLLARLPIKPSSDSTQALREPVRLTVKYQGCADAGLCYPPIEKVFDLTYPPTSGATFQKASPYVAQTAAMVRSAPSVTLVKSEQDQITDALHTRGLAWLVPAFFGFGLLLAFTPCVLPMVPILSAIIVGREKDQEKGSAARGLALSVAFVVPMALTYAAAGVVAASLGANLPAAFQHPVILTAFSAVFVALAMAMFGLYELQLPASWQTRLAAYSNRQRGGTYFGVAVMGVLSAIIVGPCVAPPLAGALAYIGQTGDTVLGGTALFALGLGMGAPLLVVGASAGHLLPKMGAWAEQVKWIFGVILLGVAVYLLERIVAPWVTLLLWATLLVIVAMYLGALDGRTEESPHPAHRLRRAAGLVALFYGVVLIVGAASGGHDLLHPLKGLRGGAASDVHEVEFKSIKTVDDLDAAIQMAAARNQAVMLDYYADWCISCKEMERYTFTNSEVQTLLSPMLLLRADVTKNDEADRALLERFDLFGPPAILFFTPEAGELRHLRVVGFMKAERFRNHMQRIPL